MLNIASDDLRTLVLIKLTKSLIENSEEYAMFKLEKMFSTEKIEDYLKKKRIEERLKIEEAKQARELQKEEIKKKVQEKLAYMPSIMKPEDAAETFFVAPIRKRRKEKARGKPLPSKGIFPMSLPRKKLVKRRLDIVEESLPEHLRYLRPTPTLFPKELELGKLEPFLRDVNVSELEIEGPGEVVYVKGTMGKKQTGIKLSKEEVDQILQTFSEVGKVPIVEGLFKVATSNLILTGMVSESLGSRFIIKKM